MFTGTSISAQHVRSTKNKKVNKINYRKYFIEEEHFKIQKPLKAQSNANSSYGYYVLIKIIIFCIKENLVCKI